MAQNSDIARLPIQRLLHQLAAAGFELTAHEWYRTELAIAQHQILLHSAEGLEELGLILGPLLCKNERDQSNFQKIYAQFLESLSAEVPPQVEPITSLQELKRAAWWLPLALLLGLLLLGGLGLDWYQENYGAARNAARFQYEVQGDLKDFKLGDTLQLLNQTTVKDTSKYTFSWYIQDENQQVRWSYDGYDYRDFVFDNPNGVIHSLHFIVRKRDSGEQIYSAPVEAFRVNCTQAPIVKDLIEVEGLRRVGELLQFSVETEGSGFAYQWNLGFDSLLTVAEPTRTYTEPGDYPIQLSLVDTSGQLGYCTTTIGTNVQIEDDQPAPVFVDLPNLTLHKDQEDLSFSFQAWTYYLLGLLALLAGLFWWLWNRQRKNYKREQQELRTAQIQEMQVADRAPYQIPFRGHSDEIQKGSLPFQMGNVLRRRQEGSRQILDIPNTIQQTVEGGGFLDLQYRLNTRPTDYLFLIDQSSAESHLARLFLYLTQTLRDQDVHVDYWTYRGGFDRFWNPKHQGYADLNQLQKAFGDRKLIVFGNGEELLDNSRVKDHLDTFGKWKYRILVTPRPLVAWSSKEKRLYQSFPIFPANLENLMDAAQLIEREWEADDLPAYFADWKQQIARKQPEDPDSETRLKRWSHYREYLEQHPQLLPWVKSLVVHPELRWDLTIALGKAMGAPVTFDNLLILSRIPAFEEGAFPTKVWREIWAQLDLEHEWQARQAMKTELEAIPEDTIQGSYAQNQLETDLDIHNFALEPYNKDYQQAIRLRMATGQIDPLRLEELDLVVSRQTDTTTPETKKGAATQQFLEQEEEPIKVPLLTLNFWLACLFTLLPILFGIGSLFVQAQTIGQYFYDKNGEVPFYLIMEMREAQRLNNLAVDNFYSNDGTASVEARGVASLDYLRQALRLEETYLLAQDNFQKLSYLLGKNAYQKTENDSSQEPLAFNYFNDLFDQLWVEVASDSIYFYALHGLASLQYSQSRPDSVCYYVDLMREAYLEQLGTWGQDMPYLSACQEEKSLPDEAPQDTTAADEGPIEPFKVFALPSTLYAPADNSFSENLINSLSQVGRNTTLQNWSIDFNNRYNNTLKFDGGSGPDESQPVFNQSPRVGNSTAVLLYAENYGAYPDLKFPLANAQGMDKALSSIGFRTETHEIRDADAFKQVINNLRNRNFGPQDQLVIYISSYFYFTDEDGENTVLEQLVPANGSLNDPGSGIYDEDFNALIAQIPCNRILVIIDPFEIEDPNIQPEKPPTADLSANFATYTQTIGGRPNGFSKGFIIDKVEDQVIVAVPYTRPSASDLKLFGPSHKIELSGSEESFEAELITDFPNEEIAFFMIPNTKQYLWEFDFSTTDLQVGQTINIPGIIPQEQRPPSEGQITAVGEESFSVTLNSGSFEKNVVLVNGRVAGLLTKSTDKGNAATGIPFDYILALWENTMNTDLDKIVPPEPDYSDDLVFVQGGTFEMGDQFGDGTEYEKPVHSVTLSDFYISDHEVTFAEYDEYCQAEGIEVPDDSGWGRGNRPVINVTWNEVVKFCNWRSEQAGLQKVYTIAPKGNTVTADWDANGYRLPTEAEWEYAARSRGRKEKYAGTSELDSLRQYAHYRTTSTAVVRSYRPNALGLYDMSGNVFEWCWDWYGRDYYAGSNNSRNPRGLAQGSYRVNRGGSWRDGPRYCRAAYRSTVGPTIRDRYLGFRLASSSR
ncbi:MAG: hypothetical protein Sapg2KO_24370 [Saprospiraceae bacterium]